MLPNLTSLVPSKHVNPTGVDFVSAADEVMGNPDLVRKLVKQVLKGFEKGQEEDVCELVSTICQSLGNATHQRVCTNTNFFEILCRQVFTENALYFASDPKDDRQPARAGGLRQHEDLKQNFYALCRTHRRRRVGMEKLVKSVEKKPDLLKRIDLQSVTIEMMEAAARGLASVLLYNHFSIRDVDQYYASHHSPQEYHIHFDVHKDALIEAVYKNMDLLRPFSPLMQGSIRQHYYNLMNPTPIQVDRYRKQELIENSNKRMIARACDHVMLEEGRFHVEIEQAFNDGGFVHEPVEGTERSMLVRLPWID